MHRSNQLREQEANGAHEGRSLPVRSERAEMHGRDSSARHTRRCHERLLRPCAFARARIKTYFDLQLSNHAFSTEAFCQGGPGSEAVRFRSPTCVTRLSQRAGLERRCESSAPRAAPPVPATA